MSLERNSSISYSLKTLLLILILKLVQNRPKLFITCLERVKNEFIFMAYNLPLALILNLNMFNVYVFNN